MAMVLALPIAVFGAEPTGYYKSCENKGGSALLSALQSVIGSYNNVGYDGLYDLYETSDVYPDGKIWDMYSTKHWSPTSSERCGNYKSVGDCYNREHSIPQSWWGGGTSGQGSDAFVVYPTDGKVNGQRSNYPYGECAYGETLSPNGSVKALGKCGSCTFPGYTGTVFEPDDEYKGDFARTYFYIAACYNSKVAQWTKNGSAADFMAGNSYPVFKDWAVKLLLKWHSQDPVSQKELDRNEAVYAEQRNRNPFIDHPEMVDYIWGANASQKWTSGAAGLPQIATPIDGDVINMGNTAVATKATTYIVVKGVNLTETVSLAITGSDCFSVEPATISAADALAGTQATISFVASTAGVYTATLTVKSGTASSTVSLQAEARDGLVANEATDVTSSSFVAHWVNTGNADDNGCYKLYVLDPVGTVEGFPVDVQAADEQYRVDGLQPLTSYVYSLRSNGLRSNTIRVTTTEPMPFIEILFDEELHFVTEPGVPSDVAELLIDIENITSDVNVAVNEPFQLSTDKADWSTSISISPEQDRIYMRVLSATEGQYTTAITASAGTYIYDDAEATATVAAGSGVAEFGVDVDYHTWDAYARSGAIIVETERPAAVAIYALDGATCFSGDVPAGTSTIEGLPAGIYIVAIGDFSRSVLIK